MGVRSHRQRARLVEDFEAQEAAESGIEDNFALAGLTRDVVDSIRALEGGSVEDVLDTARSIVTSAAPPLHDDRYHYFPKNDEPFDEKLLVDGVYDRRANVVDERTLQREHRVPGSGKGSGGGSRRKKAVLTRDPPPLEIPETHPDTPRFTLRGLTRGEVLVLRDEPGFARRKLEKVVKSIFDEPKWPELNVSVPAVHKKKQVRFEVYGLPADYVEILKLHSGLALRCLVDAAHEKNPTRIQAVDGEFVRVFRDEDAG